MLTLSSSRWVLADRLLIPSLQNTTIRLINALRIHRNRTPTSAIKYIWENTAEDSPLRKLLLKYYALNLFPNQYRKTPELVPQPMLLDPAFLLKSQTE